MLEFRILKKSKKSRARLGVLKTAHGEVETPTLVPVATNAAVKAMTAEQVEQTKTQILISNTFHLHLRPGEDMVEKSGGLHRFMQWKRPLMTDSGGFQIFSLGFGRDLNVGKILKFVPGKDAVHVEQSAQPKFLRITDEGVHFRSPYGGQKFFLGPRESMAIQEKLGADIMFAFDECTPPLVTRAYMRESLERTHRWEKICAEARRSKKQSLYGIVQGSRFEDLRKESARYINSLNFDGFAIGGDLGHDKKTTGKILDWTLPLLDERMPRHLLGIGKIEDIGLIIKKGVDTFDCTIPTHYARRGIAFTSAGTQNLGHGRFVNDLKPLDKKCGCSTCRDYRRNYLSHLVRTRELSAHTLLTFHNLYFFNTYIERIRERIKKGKL